MKLSLHDGAGREYASIDLGTPDNNGILNEAELTYGHLFIAIDGQEYGSLAFSEVIPGQAHIELGAYDSTFDQWAPQNPLTEPEIGCQCSDSFTASLTGHGHACPLYDQED